MVSRSRRRRFPLSSVTGNNNINESRPVINNSKRSTQKLGASSLLITLSIGGLATIILSSYYYYFGSYIDVSPFSNFQHNTNTRVVTPLPPHIQKFSFYIHEPEYTNPRVPIAEMHRKRGHLQVYDMDIAHFIWSKRPDDSLFTKLKPWQRYNQMPGRDYYDEKLWMALGMDQYCGKKHNLGKGKQCTFPYLPHSYLLDKEDHVVSFLKAIEHNPHKAYLLKESWVNKGAGITILGPNSQELKNVQTSLEDKSNKEYTAKDEYLIQEYICNTLLFENKFKFDLRFYWFIASIDPLIVLFRDGIGRVSTIEYDESDFSNFDMHVTNLSQNGKAVSWEDVSRTIRDHFHSHHEELIDRLGKDIDPVVHVRNQMKAILVDIINAFKDTSFVLGELTADNGFNFLALDYVIDNDLDVFLIEPQSQCNLGYTTEPGISTARNFVSDFIDVAVEVTEKQQILNQRIFPLKSVANFDVVYDMESGFQYSYEYQRPTKKKGCLQERALE